MEAIYLLIILFTASVLLSAFFSSCETALFSLSRTTMLKWEDEGSNWQKKTVTLMESHSTALVAILLGNTFVNVCLSMLGDKIAIELSSGSIYAAIAAPFVITAILLLFSEITPKTIALKKADKIAHLYTPILTFFMKVMKPMIFILEKITQVFLGKGSDEGPKAVNVEEYNTFVDLAAASGVFSFKESETLKKIFSLRYLRLENCMIPRTEMHFIEPDASQQSILEAISKYRHSRMPVYDSKEDTLVGMLVVKKFKLLSHQQRVNWKGYALEDPFYIPEQAKLNVVARKFADEKIPMAMVVDEYGGVAGLVTIEDILELVVGDISDEYDIPDSSIVKEENDEYTLTGIVHLHKLNDEIEEEIPFEGTATTVFGLLCEELGEIPKLGDKLSLGRFSFEIIAVDGPRIEQVRLKVEKKEIEDE